jgi:hypothetical protein
MTSSLSSGVFDTLQAREEKLKKEFVPPALPMHNAFNPKEPLYFSVIGGEVSFLSFDMICRSDGAVMVIPQNVLGNLYSNSFKKEVAPVFHKAVSNLMNIRNHLLLQLDLEYGNISEEYFDKEEPKYLAEIKSIPFEKLKKEIKVLFGFTNLPLDSEDISEILNCSVDDAEKALKNYLHGV